jgi:hypothetical protein
LPRRPILLLVVVRQLHVHVQRLVVKIKM